ncbi:MAG: hypothetical protein ABFS09_09355 [Thermodesulfobacteriota bacterium]
MTLSFLLPKYKKAETVKLQIAQTWDGSPVAQADVVDLSVRLTDDELTITVAAPFYGDPPPAGGEGELNGLWDYEVVELFLLAANGHYLEVEMGPHGHYLILLLAGIRQVKKKLHPSHFSTEIVGCRWQATLKLVADHLPTPFTHTNAYAIHGQGVERCYLAAYPVPGERPDFHQPHFFGLLR